MQATHVRFALEFEEALSIKDRDQYLAGVMYPDSRYVTGVDREHTHDYSVEPKDLLEGTDFEKGWKIHVIYDKLQRAYLWEMFSISRITSMCSDEWFKIAAAKLIENMWACQMMGDDIDIMTRDYPMVCPNGECESDLKDWHEQNRKVYEQGGIDLESYEPIFDYYRDLKPEIAGGWLEEYHRQVVDSDLKKQILEIYPKILKQVHDGL